MTSDYLSDLEARLRIARDLYQALGQESGSVGKRSDEDLDDVITELAEEYADGPETWAEYDSWGLDKRGLGSIA